MKTCSITLPYVLVLVVRIADAAYLRRDPNVVAGIGSAEKPPKQPKTVENHESLTEYTLTLQNYKGVQYFAPITFNDQKLSAVYDTGSFEIMAMSKMCTACKIPSPQVKYDNTSSRTFARGDRGIENHHFAGGLVVAKQDYETVHIGDLGKDFTIKHMPFWQVVDTDMRVWMSKKAQFTAIVGLGHRTVVPDTPEDQKPVESLLERTNTNRFAICLQKGISNPGYITFNPRIDSQVAGFNAVGGTSMPQALYRRVPVIGKNHWAVEMNEVSTFNGEKTDRRCHDGNACVAIIDSGTSLIGVPPIAVPMILKIAKSIKQDCSNIDQLHDLVFDLGGHRFALPPAAYIVQFRTGDVRRCMPAFTDFDMLSTHGSVWILGMPFLRHFYTVFDRTEPSIYVADQGENCEPAMSNSTANTTFVNTSFASARPHQEPAMADTSEAMLPSWALGKANGKAIVDI